MAGWWRRVFVHNFFLKFISVALAVGLWATIGRSPIAEVEIRVPIEFRNLPENLEIDSASFTEAQVRVRGPERVIHHLDTSEVRAEVDLRNVQPGERTFDLTARHVSVPQELHVVQIIPGQFHLSFDTRETRVIPVQPRVTGNFASGMAVSKVIADPQQITVTGPRRRVQALEAASTDPVDATGTMTSASFLTQAYVADPLIQIVHPTSVRVTVIMEGAKK